MLECWPLYQFIAVQLQMWSKGSHYFTKTYIRFNISISFSLYICRSSTGYFAVIFLSFCLHAFFLPSVHHPWFSYISHPFLSVFDYLHLLVLKHISFSSISYFSTFYFFLLSISIFLSPHQIVHLSLYVSVITFLCHFLPERLIFVQAGTEFMLPSCRDHLVQRVTKDTQDHQAWW